MRVLTVVSVADVQTPDYTRATETESIQLAMCIALSIRPRLTRPVSNGLNLAHGEYTVD